MTTHLAMLSRFLEFRALGKRPSVCRYESRGTKYLQGTLIHDSLVHL